MNRESAAAQLGTLRPVVAVVFAGLIAGTVDIGAASLINGKSVPYILHAIAGGLLAAKSFAGGAPTAALGLLLQELMSILIASIYVFGLRFIPDLRSRWILAGVGYGIVVYGVMNYVVLPLSAWHNAPTFKWRSFLLNMAAMWLFGLIVAYFGSRTLIANPAASGENDGSRLRASTG